MKRTVTLLLVLAMLLTMGGVQLCRCGEKRL